VAKAVFMAKSRANFDKLVDYAHRMKIAAIIRRMGFVLETLGLAGEVLITKFKAGLPPGAVKLDPQLPIAGIHQAKWGLRLNVSAEEIQKAVSN
jgi:predicted transcriptional regulator of viral defense system